MDVPEPIAIVGYAYRAPGVGGKDLWEHLAEAKSAWSPVPSERFDQAAYYHPDSERGGCLAGKGGHFLPDDIHAFDAPFFRLTPEEARAMDPQQRMLLECAVEAIESAGLLLPDIAKSNMGVFTATGMLDHVQNTLDDLPSSSKYSALGLAPCLLANRLSYFFELLGPSLMVDTACASSAYAVHLACQSIRSGECDSAIVGGATLIMGPSFWIALDTMGTLSADGKSYSYDERASGFGRGEGSACIVLKRLSEAVKCGDPIQAIIRNTAVNHCGHPEAGTISTPSRAAQESLFLQLHRDVALDPCDTAVVEGHGTGTAVGDPIEANAIATVMGANKSPDNPLYLASIKANFGHLEASSGVLALVKAIMMLQRDLILPNALFEKLNPKIERPERLKIPTEVTPWPVGAQKRICVANYGFGGSNAAILVEKSTIATRAPSDPFQNGITTAEKHSTMTNGHHTMSNSESNDIKKKDALHEHLVPLANGDHLKSKTNGVTNGDHTSISNGSNGHPHSDTRDSPSNAVDCPKSDTTSLHKMNGEVSKQVDRLRMFAFSAKSDASLQTYLSNFSQYLDRMLETKEASAADICYTLGQRRTHFPRRATFVADSLKSLRTQLSDRSDSYGSTRVNDHPAVAFAFTGQGAQFAQMAKGLEAFQPFAKAMDTAEQHLQDLGAHWSLKTELEKPESESRVNDAEISQPACTAIQVALVDLLRAWGVAPRMVIGHSSGEIAAAYAAGIISFEAAIAIAFFRGEAASVLSTDDTVEGAMLALGISSKDATSLLSDELGDNSQYATIAAVNSPSSVTISGDKEAIMKIQKAAEARSLFARRLRVNLAYHSRHMERVVASYLTSILPYCDDEALPSADNFGDVKFVSSVTGAVENSNTINASYWVKNLLQPVLFFDAIEAMFVYEKESPNIIIEVGPHSALKGPIVQSMEWLRNQCKEKSSSSKAAYAPSLVRGADAKDSMLKLAGTSFAFGCKINFFQVNQTCLDDVHVLTHLPPYSWNKSAKYQSTSRGSQQRLHPGKPYNRLLGWKSPSDQGSDCSFRQMFSLDEMPWIKEHRVENEAILPFTGYLALAIEALRLISSASVGSIQLRELHIKRGLIIEDDEQVDVTTRVRPLETGTESVSATLWRFEILSWTSKKGWLSHCYGQIEASADENFIATNSFLVGKAKQAMEKTNFQTIDVNRMYDQVEQCGVTFGPTFKRTASVGVAEGLVLTEMELRTLDSPPASSTKHGSPVTIDAPTLDTFLHGAGFIPGSNAIVQAGMPTFLRRAWISNNIPSEHGQRFTVVTWGEDMDAQAGDWTATTVVFAQSEGSLTPVAEFEALHLRRITPTTANTSSEQPPKSFYWSLAPFMDLVHDTKTKELVAIESFSQREVSDKIKMNEVGLHFMAEALRAEDENILPKTRPEYFSKFLDWARRTLDASSPNDRVQRLSPEAAASLISEVKAINAQGELLCAIGAHILPILRSEIPALEVMLKDGLLTRNYEEDTSTARGARIVAQYVRRLSDVNPDMHILEVGAGTGGGTKSILEAMSNDKNGSVAFSNYTFTDISSGFFTNAQEKLKRWDDHITYQKLDISQDPVELQGFKAEAYDLVIAVQVLHATSNLDETIKNVRKLLKPRGRLVVLEIEKTQPTALPFALLPGWWLAEDSYRSQDGPMASNETWNDIFLKTGFSGTELVIPDYPDTSVYGSNVICTTRVPDPQMRSRIDNHSTALYTNSADVGSASLLSTLATSIEQHLGQATITKSLTEFTHEGHELSVFVDGPQHSVLENANSDTFTALKSLFLDADSSLLWIIPRTCNPDGQVIKGLLRSLRLEDETKNLFVLENADFSSEGFLYISDMLRYLGTLIKEGTAGADQEFVWQDGLLNVPRLRSLEGADEAFDMEAGLAVKKLQKIQDHPDPLKLKVEAVGSPDATYFGSAQKLAEEPGAGEILIRNEFSGVNFLDLLLVQGSIPWTSGMSTGPGFEGMGIVDRVGPEVTDFKTGDRIFYMTNGGSIATHVRIPSCLAHKVPTGASGAEAAGMPVAYVTALMCLAKVARLQKGESILVHSAAGATGQACVRVAQHMGAEVFATAGTPEKRAFLESTVGIPKTHIFSSRTAAFRDGILSVTKGRGVDVVVNSLAGALLQETWTLVADFGRWCEIGKMDFIQNNNLPMRPLLRNVSFNGVDIKAYMIERPEVVKSLLAEVANLYEQGAIPALSPTTALPASDLTLGLRKLQTGQSLGKIVLALGPDQTALAEPPRFDKPLEPFLRADATYLISGGTGGIGRSLGPWMFENGARNVVLLGRSGSKNPEVAKLIQKYEGTQYCLKAIPCDVGDRGSLAGALEAIKDLPAVRGVMHGALYLRDAKFSNATFDDWKKITAPKIQGAWNLHESVPNLDFFVSLGSMASEGGNFGQAIYAGTGTFLDAFSRYRVARGLHAVNISIPVVEDVGYVAEKGINEQIMRTVGISCTASELQMIVRGAILGPSSGLNVKGKAFTGRPNAKNDAATWPWRNIAPVAVLRPGISSGGPQADGKSGRQAHENDFTDASTPDFLPRVLNALMQKVSSMTMIDMEEISPSKPVSEYGLDSLVSVELRNWIRRAIDVELSMDRIIRSAHLQDLADFLVRQRQAKSKV